MAALSLTSEQLERIARNRAEANKRLALREGKLASSQENIGVGIGDRRLPAVVQDENRPVRSGAGSAEVNTCYGRIPDPATSDRLPVQVVITYRDEQPSTSAASIRSSIPAKNEEIERRFSASSPVKGAVVPSGKKYPVNVTIKLADAHSFQVQFKPFSSSVVAALKKIRSKIYHPETKVWSFSLEDIYAVEKALQALDDVSVEIEKVPYRIVKALLTYRKSVSIDKEPVLDGNIEKTLTDALFPYQRRGVICGILKRGRLLLADEMGLGKSIQALGIARYFKSDWPLLIICPSSVKFSWLNQFEMFLLGVADITVIEKGSDRLPQRQTNRTVVIMSYDLMVSKRSQLIEYGFKAIIFDESHLLKDNHAQRTKVAMSISRKALRVILLTGTPALSRPVELFTQIRIIDPDIFPNYRDFAIRYCDGRQGRYRFEAKGCTNSDELAAVLTGSVMLRRLKKDVLDDLPEKRQEVVYLKDDSIYTNIAKLRETKAAYREAKDKDTKHQRLIDYYYETGIAKAKSVTRYITDHYFYDGAPKRKILVFAHHQVVLNTISIDVAKKGLRSIRIDGATASKLRDEQCRLFQENDEVLVAVLSMTAAGIGITLTAASVVVFAELHWNPGTLKQAEDRAHRLGQKDSVFVQYLIATGTADDILWPLIQKKLDVLQSCKLSVDTYRGADSVQTTMGLESGGLEDYFPKAKRVRSNEK